MSALPGVDTSLLEVIGVWPQSQGSLVGLSIEPRNDVQRYWRPQELGQWRHPEAQGAFSFEVEPGQGPETRPVAPTRVHTH